LTSHAGAASENRRNSEPKHGLQQRFQRHARRPRRSRNSTQIVSDHKSRQIVGITSCGLAFGEATARAALQTRSPSAHPLFRPPSFGPSKGWSCVEGPAGCAPNGALIVANGARVTRSSENQPAESRPDTRRPRKYRQGRQNRAISRFPRPPEHGTSREPMAPDQLTLTDQMLDVSHCCRGQRGLWASPRPSKPPSAPILGRSGRAREH